MKLIKKEIYNALYQDYYESYYEEPISYLDFKEIVENVKSDGSVLSKFSVRLDQDHSDSGPNKEYENLEELEPLFGHLQSKNIEQITFNSILGEEPLVSHLIAPNSGYYNKMVFNKKTAEFLAQKKIEQSEEKKKSR